MFSSILVAIRKLKTYVGAERGLPELWTSFGAFPLTTGQKAQEGASIGAVFPKGTGGGSSTCEIDGTGEVLGQTGPVKPEMPDRLTQWA